MNVDFGVMFLLPTKKEYRRESINILFGSFNQFARAARPCWQQFRATSSELSPCIQPMDWRIEAMHCRSGWLRAPSHWSQRTPPSFLLTFIRWRGNHLFDGRCVPPPRRRRVAQLDLHCCTPLRSRCLFSRRRYEFCCVVVVLLRFSSNLTNEGIPPAPSRSLAQRRTPQSTASYLLKTILNCHDSSQ
ncbi:hypothetical protein VTI28DRAFT_9771 [Corynascus sepedonium]